jgi:ABC-type lipoprotein release transport system permease subunit
MLHVFHRGLAMARQSDTVSMNCMDMTWLALDSINERIVFPLELSHLVTAAVLPGVVSLLSAAIPAGQATRMQVVDAIWAS